MLVLPLLVTIRTIIKKKSISPFLKTKLIAICCVFSNLPTVTIAYYDICLLLHLPMMTFAYDDTCLLRHLPALTHACSDTFLLSPLPALRHAALKIWHYLHIWIHVHLHPYTMASLHFYIFALLHPDNVNWQSKAKSRHWKVSSGHPETWFEHSEAIRRHSKKDSSGKWVPYSP